MSGTNSSGYNVRRHQAKSKHLNLYERLAGDISVQILPQVQSMLSTAFIQGVVISSSSDTVSTSGLQ
jgi:hypothetical protein